MSMLDLFRLDAEGQLQALNVGLLALERVPTAADQLESCMRAAHSLKGAARIVGLDAAVTVAHALEDCFVAAQRGAVTLGKSQIDALFRGVDLLKGFANAEATADGWTARSQAEVATCLTELTAVREGGADVDVAAPQNFPERAPVAPAAVEGATAEPEESERVLRVTAQHLNRLLGVAAESQVASRWLTPFAQSLLRLKRLQYDAAKALERLSEALPDDVLDDRSRAALADARHRALEIQELLSARLAEVQTFERRQASVARRLYEQALACRMRPFADGTRFYPRFVRDLARALDKHVRLEIVGETTLVDRDILEALDAPLGHLLRNAIDHGIESHDERRACGKPSEGVVRLEASHSGGTLQILVADDGRGVDVERVRSAVIARNLIDAQTALALSPSEVLEFLFLPGFTMKTAVTEISGRGVGLDAVRKMIEEVGGSIRIVSRLGKEARFQLQLPLSLSVIRTLLVEIGGEPYAFPLAHIIRTLLLRPDKVKSLEGRQMFDFDGRPVALIGAQHVLHGEASKLPDDYELPIVVVGDGTRTYGLVADRFLGERELVIQPLDARLGKIGDIAAGALMEDGSPVLIVDIEDMLRSIEKVIAVGRLSNVRRDVDPAKKRKRVLVVDDSLTVRELERKLLDNAGYEVDVAVDGMNGWNAVRAGHFDLVVTDVDMPRMGGIELVTLIKKDSALGELPVVIVSYKDREEDRRRGLDAGADYYLTKGSFDDRTLLQAVVALIGEAA